MCKICSKLTIKAPERRHWRRFGVFIANFKQRFVLVFSYLTLNKQIPTGNDLKEKRAVASRYKTSPCFYSFTDQYSPEKLSIFHSAKTFTNWSNLHVDWNM